jgi:hypothetical protein
MKHIPSIVMLGIVHCCGVGHPVVSRSNEMWNPSLSEFVLNRICELVDRGLNLSCGFKECYLKIVCNDVKDFTGITVTPGQVCNHMRKWKEK